VHSDLCAACGTVFAECRRAPSSEDDEGPFPPVLFSTDKVHRQSPEISRMSAKEVIKLLKEKEVKFVDLRFTDTRGKEQHVSLPAKLIDDEFFRDG
jgi:hypothetical protein